MNVIMAESAGFCFGVKKAMDMVEEQIEQKGDLPIYTYGPIIHNAEVVRDLESRGVITIKDDEELKKVPKGIMIIRSHGVPKRVNDTLLDMGFKIVDATCPFVKRIHNEVSRQSAQGKKIIIVGNATHPEVEGIIGWCNSKPYVIESVDEIENIPFRQDESYCLVSQTTFNHRKFKDIVEKIAQIGYDVTVVDTICNATDERQRESREVAKRVDTMIVIGDAHSSNSKKLFEICKEECEDTHFIQTLNDLKLELPKSVRLVGITAGASTPNNIIEEVQNYVRVDF